MKNLEIISTSINVQAREIINENIVNYNFNHEEGKPPLAIVFSVHRKANDPASINGTYFSESEKFDFNSQNFQAGDGLVQEQIYATCQSIVESLKPKPATQEEEK